MTTSLDSPEVMLLPVLLGTGFLDRPSAVVILLIVERVFQLVVTAWADKDLLLVRDLVWTSIAGEASSSRRWGLEVRLGRRLPAATVTTEPVSLVVEIRRVACERVGVHWNGRCSSDELDVSLSNIAVGEKPWKKTSDRSHKVATKKLAVLVSLGRGRSRRRQTAVGGDVVFWRVSREINDCCSCSIAVKNAAIAAVQRRGAAVLGHVSTLVLVLGAVLILEVMAVSKDVHRLVSVVDGAVRLLGEINHIDMMVPLMPGVSLLTAWWGWRGRY